MTATGVKPASQHPVPARVVERFWDRVEKKGRDECWPWKLSVGSHGYGQIGWWVGDRSAGTTAHRVAWIATYGPIPDALTVDHICRNRRCCNPGHLRLLTNLDNATDNGWAAGTRERLIAEMDRLVDEEFDAERERRAEQLAEDAERDLREEREQ